MVRHHVPNMEHAGLSRAVFVLILIFAFRCWGVWMKRIWHVDMGRWKWKGGFVFGANQMGIHCA
jgi:hypothetical protein